MSYIFTYIPGNLKQLPNKAGAESTHPDDATLVDPLSALRKEGKKNKNPLFMRSIERVVERSNDRVSKSARDIKQSLSFYQRQIKVEGRSITQLTLHTYFAIVCIDDLGRDVQTHAQTTGHVLFIFDPVKAFKNLKFLFF